MAGSQIADRIQVIDTDTHVIEPYDLWTSRVSKKWGDLVPHVRTDPKRGDDRWWFGGKRSWAAAGFAQAGWTEFPPDHPPTIDDAHIATHDATARVRLMDDYGIHAQVLFPNIGGFSSADYRVLGDPTLIMECVRAYNDWLHDWTSVAPERYIKIAAIPYWDIDAAIQESHRVFNLGFKGVLFTRSPDAGTTAGSVTLPNIADPHWEPLFHTWEDLGFPVQFHGGGGGAPATLGPRFHLGYRPNGLRANYAKNISGVGGGSQLFAELIGSGICHRFPKLNFVAVESGIGWIPSFCENMDWQWTNCGVRMEHPEYDLMPSEYARRQLYANFWYEKTAARTALLEYTESCLYETDFPHPTSMSPGPKSWAVKPRDFIEEAFDGLPDDVTQKVLHDNAARIFHVDG